MGSEVTRASDTDRQRYLDHLNYLFAEGYIQNRAEADQLRAQLMEARSLSILNSTLSGMPLPPMPQQRRDWGIPERWVPVTIGMFLAGAFIAAVPSTALAHSGDSFSNALTAAFLVIGIAICIAAIVTACCAGVSWDNIGQYERDQRRSKDRNRNVKPDRDR
jgi:hypothetical protein